LEGCSLAIHTHKGVQSFAPRNAPLYLTLYPLVSYAPTGESIPSNERHLEELTIEGQHKFRAKGTPTAEAEDGFESQERTPPFDLPLCWCIWLDASLEAMIGHPQRSYAPQLPRGGSMNQPKVAIAFFFALLTLILIASRNRSSVEFECVFFPFSLFWYQAPPIY